jgi:hypothetical protein
LLLVARNDILPLTHDDGIAAAQQRFVDDDVLALPIVNSLEDQRVLGLVKRFDVSSAYVRSVHGQSVRKSP